MKSVTTKALKIIEEKRCGKCDKLHTVVPAGSIAMTGAGEMSGFYFQCECSETPSMFVPVRMTHLKNVLVECFSLVGKAYLGVK